MNQDTPEKNDKPKKVRPVARTMEEATAGLKNLNAKRKKSKAGPFVKGTHGSGAAKMRASYKQRKQSRNKK